MRLVNYQDIFRERASQRVTKITSPQDSEIQESTESCPFKAIDKTFTIQAYEKLPTKWANRTK